MVLQLDIIITMRIGISFGKKDFAKALSMELGLSGREANSIFEQSVGYFRLVLKESGSLKLPFLGIFKICIRTPKETQIKEKKMSAIHSNNNNKCPFSRIIYTPSLRLKKMISSS